MALVHVFKNGAAISEKHVHNDGVRRDEGVALYLDGLDQRKP